MNRIQKYQDSIDRFFQNKSYLIYLNKNDCDKIINHIKNDNFLITIFLLTISNNINKKNRIHQHGYYIGSAIELALLILRQTEKKTYYNFDNNLLVKITNLINILLVQNLDLSSCVLSKDKLIKNYNNSIKQINSKIINILDSNQNNANEKLKYSDLIYYKFKNKNIKEKIKKYNKICNNEINNYIENKYGGILELACCLTWNLGGGNENLITHIRKLGIYFAFLIKIYFDISELEKDIENNIENNIIIHLGIQNTFEYFINYKKKFIELSLKLGMFNNTTKEILDYLEEKMDQFINNTDPFMEEIEI